MRSRAEQAGALFKEGYNCSQAVFATYADLFGMEKRTALRAAASFGAGIGRMREVCGAASGMFMIAGMLTGAVEGKDQTAKKNNYEIVQFLAGEFKKENRGTYICRELLGLAGKDGAKPQFTETTPEARTEEYYKKRPCVKTIEGAAAIAERVLLDGLVETLPDGTERLVPMESYTEFILERIHRWQEAEQNTGAEEKERQS